jgi:hypothetical protein
MPFYTLEVEWDHSCVELAEGNDWESIQCDAEPGHQRAGRRITPLFVDLTSWRTVDFSRTFFSDLVITEHALSVLRDARLTGFEVCDTFIKETPKRRRGTDLPKLWELVVTGKGGHAHKDSDIVQRSHCTSCGHVRYSAFERGIRVDESTYDGSDLFAVTEYPKYILLSARAKLVIESARLTNAGFIESSQIEWPEGVVRH